MTKRMLLTAGAMALALAACASSETTPAATETTPAAAAGEPATAEPALATTGGETQAAPPAPEPAAPAANTAEPPAPMPSAGAIVLIKVKDYDAWKTAFDADMQRRKEASAVGHGIMREVGNDKGVAIWMAVTDAQKAKAMLDDKSLAEVQKAAGVQGKPTVYVMNTVAAQMDPKATGLSAAIVRVQVKDFAAFKTAFDSSAQARTDAGIVGYGMGQDIADPNVVYLYLQAQDQAKLKAFVDAKETKKSWKDAGLEGAAKVTIVSEGEQAMYQ
jgi:quinol monooxygenase YgiN